MPTLPTSRTSRTTENLVSQLRGLRRSNRAQRAETDGSARELVMVAFAVPAAALVVLAVVVLGVLLMAGSGLTGLGSAVASCWLAIHQVPVTLSGVTIGVLPLLPTLVVIAITGRLAAGAARSRATMSELLAVVLAGVAGPLLITAMALAVVLDGATVLPIQSPNALVAFAYTLGVHAAGALGGVAWSRRHDASIRLRLSAADRRGIRMGLAAVLLLFIVAALLVSLRLLMRRETLGQLMETGNGFDGYLGLTMLSLLYLPNLVVGAVAVLVGSDAHVGSASFELFTVHGGPVPPVPALAVLPEPPGAGNLGVLGFLVPLAVAGFVAWRCRDLDPLANVRSVGVAAAVASSLVAVLSAMAGGGLGEFGDVGITVPAACVYTLGWIVVVGMVTAVVYGVLPATRLARAQALAASDVAGASDDEYGEWGFDDDYVIVTDAELDGEYDGGEYDDGEYDEAEYENSEYEDSEYSGGYEASEYEDGEYDDPGYGAASRDAASGDRTAERPVTARMSSRDVEDDFDDDFEGGQAYDLHRSHSHDATSPHAP